MSRFARTLRHGLRPGFRTGARCLRQNRQSSGNRAVRRDFPLHCSSPRPRTGFVRTSSDHVRRTGALGRLALDYTRDTDPVETQEWLDSLDGVLEVDGPQRAHFLLDRADGRRAPPRRAGPVLGQHALPQHHPGREAAAPSGRPGHRAQHPVGDPLERARDRAARQQDLLGARRPHRQLPVGRARSTTPASALLARAVRDARRRPDLHPGPLRARHLRPRLPRGAAHARSSC